VDAAGLIGRLERLGCWSSGDFCHAGTTTSPRERFGNLCFQPRSPLAPQQNPGPCRIEVVLPISVPTRT